jgi:hypothetical protein
MYKNHIWHLVAMQGAFAVHKKFTLWNVTYIENINQMVYNMLRTSEL